jgi:hypothetical protein
VVVPAAAVLLAMGGRSVACARLDRGVSLQFGQVQQHVVGGGQMQRRVQLRVCGSGNGKSGENSEGTAKVCEWGRGHKTAVKRRGSLSSGPMSARGESRASSVVMMAD